MKLKYLFFYLTLLFVTPIFSQENSIVDKIQFPGFIDTVFIDRDINNWSLRLYTNYKDNRFQLKNKDSDLLYVPSNPFGIGVGFATKKLVLDVGFNIKNKSKDPTDRFDLRASILFKNHQFDYVFQNYKGYTLKNENEIENDFREDFSSLVTGLNYMYVFNANEYSLAAMKSGLARQKKLAFSFGLGGFFFTEKTKADSSIIPIELDSLYNDEAQIESLFGIGTGVLGSFSVALPFYKYFFISPTITGGVGLMYKNVETEYGNYTPSNPMLYQYGIACRLGYNGNSFYINLSSGISVFTTDLDYGNKTINNNTISKFAIGYKLGRRKK